MYPHTARQHHPDDTPHPAPRNPAWGLSWRMAVVAGCLGFATLTACSVSLGTKSIDEPSDIAIGDCLRIGENDDPNKVDASAAACDSESGLTFYAATKVAAGAECEADNTSTLTFADDAERLCLTPNFATGQCYQIPFGGRLADYREVECTVPAADSTVIAQTIQRGGPELRCGIDETAWTFSSPRPLGYCLREVGS